MKKLLKTLICIILALVLIAGAALLYTDRKLILNTAKFNGKQKAKHLIVISLDAMGQTDMPTASELPNFKMMLQNGTHTYKLSSIYPTLTYPVHTTMVTGVYPDKHGVTHNHQLQPGVPDSEQTWYWYRREVKAKTIYDLANSKGMITSGMLWPVTGKAAIDYNFPELAAIKNENQTVKILTNGTLPFLLSQELRLGKQRKSTDQPDLDDYVTICASDVIKAKKPNLLLIHFTDLDTMKHKYGTKSRQAADAIKRLDTRLGKIVQATKDAGIYQDTVFMVLGDHSQIDINYHVYLNILLGRAGLITPKGDGVEWRAYLQSTGGSAFLHVKPGDTEAERIAIDVLTEAAKDPQYGIEKLLDRKELDKWHADKTIKLGVEAKPGYHFKDEMNNYEVENLEELSETYATHGYLPDKPDYKCVFFAFGSGIKQGSEIGDIQMVDIAPTMAEILGLEMKNVDGKVITDIFK